jgi:hypothetical protein
MEQKERFISIWSEAKWEGGKGGKKTGREGFINCWWFDYRQKSEKSLLNKKNLKTIRKVRRWVPNWWRLCEAWLVKNLCEDNCRETPLYVKTSLPASEPNDQIQHGWQWYHLHYAPLMWAPTKHQNAHVKPPTEKQMQNVGDSLQTPP